MRSFLVAALCAVCAFGCASSGEDGGPSNAIDDDSGTGGGDSGRASGRDAGNGSGDGGIATGNDGAPPNNQTLIEMVSGNGSDVLAGWPTSDPLLVRVTKNGQPVVGEVVHWTVTPGTAPLHAAANATTSTTDADGLAQMQLVGEQFNVITSWVAETVTASIASGGSVPFIVTTVFPGPPVGNPATSPLVQITQPQSVSLGQLKAGTIVHAGLQIEVIAQIGPDTGKGIPNTGLRLVDPSDPYHLAPAKGVSCVGGTILSDARGHLSCDLQIGTRLGQVGVDAFVGGFNLHSLIVEIVP